MKDHPISPLLLIIFFLLTCLPQAMAQEEDEDEEYTREFVWGINKNTNGGYIGGLSIKLSNLIAPGTYRTLGFEAANVKSPKETRFSPNHGGGFILGKVNYLYALRFSYGRERVVFKKGPQQGVQINLLASAGPTIGLVAPYYVEFVDGNGSSTYTVPYNPDLNISGIYGPGRPLQGIEESKIAPGIHVRTGVTFEFGTFKTNVSGLELGLMMEAYPQRVQLLAKTAGSWFFPSAYLTLFHGSRR